jgi:polyisoprenoid-binding protein YceI
MKKHILFTTFLSLLLLAASAAAQKAPSFAGTWTMDVAKSRISDREKAAIEFQTITAVQSDQDMKVTIRTKRVAPAGAPAAASAVGEMTANYTFDGKEMTTSSTGPDGKSMPMKTSGKWDGSKLVLTTTRTFGSPNGEVTTVQKETWDLMPDGNTLIIRRDHTGPEGTTTSARVYTKS